MSTNPSSTGHTQSADSGPVSMSNTAGKTVPTSGYWKPSCGAAAKHLYAGTQFPSHHSSDVWYLTHPDPHHSMGEGSRDAGGDLVAEGLDAADHLAPSVGLFDPFEVKAPGS